MSGRQCINKAVRLGLVILFLSVSWAPTTRAGNFGATQYTYQETWGQMPEGTGLLFTTPVGMAEDNAGNLYVADMGNSRIVKLSPDGVVLARLGTLGTGPGQFDLPFGVAVDGEGNLLVSDTANSRLQKFTGDFTFIGQWGTPGSGDGQFNLVRQIAVDDANNYYVTDEFNNRVQKFDRNGNFSVPISSSWLVGAGTAGGTASLTNPWV